jgi:hypothetical protein
MKQVRLMTYFSQWIVDRPGPALTGLHACTLLRNRPTPLPQTPLPQARSRGRSATDMKIRAFFLD